MQRNNSKTAQKVYRPKIKSENTELANQKPGSRTGEGSTSTQPIPRPVKKEKIAAPRSDKIEEEEKTTIPSDSDPIPKEEQNVKESKKPLLTTSQVSEILFRDNSRPHTKLIYRAKPANADDALVTTGKTKHKSADFAVETKTNNKMLNQQESTNTKEEKQERKECIDEKDENKSPTIIKSIRFVSRPLLQTVDATEKSETGVELEKLVGPYADDYADLYYFIKANQHNMPQWPIANFSSDTRLYFEETPEVKKVAQLFLQHYWSDEKNIEATLQMQRAKHKREARNPNDAIMASCITFVLGRIDGKQFCFIGLSVPEEGPQQKILYETLIKSIQELNKIQKIEFVLINGSTANLSKIICALAGNKTKATFRTCAEKGLAAFFAKLWMGGVNLFLDGALNLLMFPFKKNEKYGEKSNKPENKKVKEIKPFVKNGEVVNILDILPNIFSIMIMCCPSCQETNPLIKQIWQGAKSFFEHNKQKAIQLKTGEDPARSPSPLRRSIRTATSLETLTIFTSANPNSGPKVEDSKKWQHYSRIIY